MKKAPKVSRRVRYPVESPEHTKFRIYRKGKKKKAERASSRRGRGEIPDRSVYRAHIPIWVSIRIDDQGRMTEFRRVIMRLDTGADFSVLPNPLSTGSPLTGLQDLEVGFTRSSGLFKKNDVDVVDVRFVIEGFPEQEFNSYFGIRPAKKETTSTKQATRFSDQGLLSLADVLPYFSVDFTAGGGHLEKFAVRLAYQAGGWVIDHPEKVPGRAQGTVRPVKGVNDGSDVFLMVNPEQQ